MKTAVSIPDPIFEAADRLARRRRISRSELYAEALAQLLEADESRGITERLDDVYGERPSELDPGLAAAQAHRDRRGLVIARGEIWWAELPAPTGSGPGRRRPVLVVSADSFNLSRIGTVVAVAISSNVDLAAAPGNVAVPAGRSGLPKDSVVNVSQIVTLDKRQLAERVGALDHDTLAQVDAGLRLVLELVL